MTAQRMDSAGTFDKVKSIAAASGSLDSVIGHEPVHPFGNGVHGALWFRTLGPVPKDSGLKLTSGRLALTLRIYTQADVEPDTIEGRLLAATDELLYLYSGDYSLGDTVRNIDLLGSAGAPLGAEAGWDAIGTVLFRTVTITIPIILNDVWEQTS